MTKPFKGSTYGETTLRGIDTLINEFEDHFNNPNSVFYDLGSGKGDMVIYIASNTPVKKACGIELHKERFNIAQEKLNKLSLDNTSFLNQDILESDISDATIIYVDNLAMPVSWMDKLWDNIPKNTLIISAKPVKINSDITRTRAYISRTYAKKLKCIYKIKE